MTTLQTLIITISFVLFSCGMGTKNSLNNNSILNDLRDTLKSSQQISISDTIKKFEVDDFPVTNKMMADKTINNSSYKKQSGQLFSYDKAWFKNDSLNQTLVFELYTDYFRMVTYAFYNDDIPTDLINRMELNLDGGELASLQQKLKDFNGFLKQATKINSAYFISDKGFKLGDLKKKAIDIYGKPDKDSVSNKLEILEWRFFGDIFYDGKTNLNGKRLAKDSYGHHIVMYFKYGKLIGQILYNEIP